MRAQHCRTAAPMRPMNLLHRYPPMCIWLSSLLLGTYTTDHDASGEVVTIGWSLSDQKLYYTVTMFISICLKELQTKQAKRNRTCRIMQMVSPYKRPLKYIASSTRMLAAKLVFYRLFSRHLQLGNNPGCSWSLLRLWNAALKTNRHRMTHNLRTPTDDLAVGSIHCCRA